MFSANVPWATVGPGFGAWRRGHRCLVASRSPTGILVLVAVLAAMLGILRLLPVARAGHIGRWPGGVVRYYDATGTQGSVDAAAARWNAAGAHVRLIVARSARTADV